MRPFDKDGKFHPVGNEIGLATRAVRGAGVTMLSAGLGLAIQVIGTVVLVRLLSPADFGLIAMVTTFSLLLMNFGVNGLTEAIIQREEMDHALASNLFWLNVGVGLVLTFGFAAAGALLATFYGDSRVKLVTLGISATIFITSLSVQHLALLKRAMRFSVVSANDVVSRIISVAVSIILAWAGYGYWALVAGALAAPLSASIGAWFLCRWLPGLPKAAEGTGSALWFATNTFGRFAVNYVTRNADNLLVGWHFGAVSLGFYKKAYDLFALPAGQSVTPLAEVALSTLSRLKPQSVEYRQYFLAALSALAFMGMALAADLTLVGRDLILLLLGPKWEPAGRIFTFFGPGIGAMILYHTQGWIHLSIGRADRWFRWVIVEVIVTGLLFLLALPWGPEGIAAAWTASFWILIIPSLWYAGSPIDFGVAPMLATVWRYTLSSLLAGLATFAILPRIASLVTASGSAGALYRLLDTSLVFGGLYLGAVVIAHGGLDPLYRFSALAVQMIPWWRRSKPVPAFASNSSSGTGSLFISKGSAEPLVSILIPAFNAQDFISDSIRSALSQTWPRKEVIVVDDGSTDRTRAIAQGFAADGVRVVTQKNQGAASARNTALSLCKGDYIQWLDADDLLAPDKIAAQMEVLSRCQSNRILASCGFGRFTYRHYRAEFNRTSLWCDLSPVECLLRKLRDNVYMQTAAWLVSRELTEAAGQWDSRLMGDDDGEYFCRVVLASEGVRFVPEAKVYYRAPTFVGLSYVGLSPKKLDAHWLSMQLHIRYLLSREDSQATRAACLQFLNDNLLYFYPERVDTIKQMKELAKDLGGSLAPSRFSWKYSWIVPLLGWRIAKRVQVMAPKAKWGLKRKWDKILFSMDKINT